MVVDNHHFFELIQIALKRRTCFSVTPSAKEWDGLLIESTKQSLVGVLSVVFDRIPKEQLPPLPLMMDWLGQAQCIRIQSKIADESSKGLSSFFGKVGYRSTIMKGQGIALYYPDPLLRQSGDVDILVDGKMEDIISYCKEHWTIDHIGIKNLVITNHPDVKVEVHFIPSWFYSPFSNRRFVTWYKSEWNNLFNDTEKGFCVPHTLFNLVFCMVHIYKHLFDEGIGLRQMMDYYYVLLHSNKEERNSALVILNSFGMGSFVGAVMFVMKVVFDLENERLLCAYDKQLGGKLLSDIMIGGNFGHYNVKNSHGKENRVQHGIRNVRHNLALLKDYPSEVVWSPVWKCWHWCWRKKKGYL